MFTSDALVPISLQAARALRFAAGHINVSVKNPIPDVVLLDALRTGAVLPEYDHHILAFFDETDTATIADLVISGAVTYGQLAAWADRLLPELHETRSWLDERRAF